MTRSLRPLFAMLIGLAIAMLLLGCGSLGQEKPRSPEDTLRYGQATLTAVYDTLKQNNDAKTISLATASRVKLEADRAKRVLDTAEPAVLMGLGDTPTVQEKLTLALSILQPLLIEMQAALPKKTSEVSAVPIAAAAGAVVTLEAINALISGIMALLALIDRNGVVSRIIAQRIAEGRKDWTDAERAQVTEALDEAEAAAQASIDARRVAEGGAS